MATTAIEYVLIHGLRFVLAEAPHLADKLREFLSTLTDHSPAAQHHVGQVFAATLELPVPEEVRIDVKIVDPPQPVAETKATPPPRLDVMVQPKNIPETPFYEWSCPWCFQTGLDSKVIVAETELNCRRMIHGVFKQGGQPVPPHASRVECEQLLQQSLINGCGKALQITADLKLVAVPYES